MPTYVDTSALVKRYVAETGSDSLEAFLARQEESCVVSPLVATELESVLRRLARQRLIDDTYAERTRREFANDLSGALWSMQPFASDNFRRAADLLRDLDCPLAALDALHLACAHDLGCAAFATADHQLARAAKASGLDVHLFT
jgi:uncharacterized protein